jgi:hypothetical protein
MHNIPTNLAIKLTEREKELAARIDFNPSAGRHNADSWRPVAEAMHELMVSLLQRNAIPEPRMKFFTDPAYSIGGHGLSRQQVFEKNGTRGDAIFRHGHFVKYLHYFIYGPDLSQSVIDDFRQAVADCGEPFTSSDALSVGDSARQVTRVHGLNPSDAAEGFYKLALDCGLDAGDARTIRDSVKKVRPSRSRFTMS